MSKCRRYSYRILSEAADGECQPSKQAAVDLHLAECADCAETVAKIKDSKRAFQTLPQIQLSENFDAEFKSALLLARQEKKTNTKPKKVLTADPRFSFSFLPKLAPVAAVLILSVTMALGVYSLLSPGSGIYLASLEGDVQWKRSSKTDWMKVTKKVQLIDGDKIRTGPGAKAFISAGKLYRAEVLPDSEVHAVDLASSIKEGDIRIGVSKGGILVKTGRRFPGNQMVVRGPSGEAKVVGTVFMMQALPSGSTRLSVSEGKVDFDGKRIEGEEGQPLRVDRFESSEVVEGGTPRRSRPLSVEAFQALGEIDSEMARSKTVGALLDAAKGREKIGRQDLKQWQKKLLGESDLELAGFGFFLLGEIEEEKMAPAEALQQYSSVLQHYPDTVESSWAFEFMRSKLGLVPNDADLIGDEIDPKVFASLLRESSSGRDLTSGFLKGLEPQRKFVSTQFRLSGDDGAVYLVDRAITFERMIGNKTYYVVGYLDTVKTENGTENLLRIGKLFTRKSNGGPVSEVNTAVFHPDGYLLYTIERKIAYQGKTPVGYTEKYKDPNGKDLARLTRQIESRSRKGKILRYNETVRNAKNKVLLNRKRTGIVYNEAGEVIDYEDVVVDVHNRRTLERGSDQLKVAVGEEQFMKVEEKPFATMDEVLKTLRRLRKQTTSFEREYERGSPFRTR